MVEIWSDAGAVVMEGVPRGVLLVFLYRSPRYSTPEVGGV